MAEINITPFTDVVLVLLIIFMITTPLFVQSAIKVKLPSASSSETESGKNLMILIGSDGHVTLNSKGISLDELKSELEARTTHNPDAVVVVNADKQVRYEHVIQVLDITKQSGVKRLALGVELLKDTK